MTLILRIMSTESDYQPKLGIENENHNKRSEKLTDYGKLSDIWTLTLFRSRTVTTSTACKKLQIASGLNLLNKGKVSVLVGLVAVFISQTRMAYLLPYGLPVAVWLLIRSTKITEQSLPY